MGGRRRRHHTGILPEEGCSALSVAHPWAYCLFLSLFAVPRRFSLQPSHATSRSSHSRRSLSCRFFLCRVALLCCLILRRRRRLRSLALAASAAFRRNSALLAAYPGPSSLSSSPRARTTLLTPTGMRQRLATARVTNLVRNAIVALVWRLPRCTMVCDHGERTYSDRLRSPTPTWLTGPTKQLSLNVATRRQ